MADGPKETAELDSAKRKCSEVADIKKSWIPKKRRLAGFDEAMFKETTYYFADGLRHVKPYHFTFATHCKGRWIGKSIFDVYKNEFRMESPEYYKNAIMQGRIKVNGEKVSPTKVLTNNDFIETQVHRHEPPVIPDRIEVIHKDDDVVIVNKPSSIPVHPCGRYRHNTIVFLLGREHDLCNLHTVHRIDRLTSGILMFARNASKARELEKAVRGRKVYKEYICKVQGEFPSCSTSVDQPIQVVSHKIGVCSVRPEGKPCKTDFELISTDGETSLVKCIPHTGRMHQIRVHLQWLGYPIVNDPIYNHPVAWGATKGKNGSSIDTDEVLKHLIASRKENQWNDDPHGSTEQSLNDAGDNDTERLPPTIDGTTTTAATSVNENTILPREQTDSSNGSSSEYCEKSNEDNTTTDPFCKDCKVKWKDPAASELIMYLHAWKYKGPGWEYEASMPKWAEVDKTESVIVQELT